MPLGKFGEVIGTMNTLGENVVNYESKVVAPKNPKLLRERAPYMKLTPSEYMFKMSLDTQRKLQNTRIMELPQKLELLDMSNTTYQKNTVVTMEDPLFQPFPSSLFFINCEPHETHELPLTLRNNDRVPRLVKVTMADSPYFRVVAPPNASHKVAAGLPTVFKIQFTPDRRQQDYHLGLEVITERERFLVPVHCLGARAVLDLPDEVTFPPTAVRYTETKTLLVRNVGNDTANFSIVTKGPFSVAPSSAVLEVNESLQLVVGFLPEEAREYREELVVQYETGEDVYVQVLGAGQEVPVRLERSQVQVEETYVGLANLRTVTLHNRSDVLVNFHWSNFASREAEELDRESLLRLLDTEEAEDVRGRRGEPSLLSAEKLSIVSRNYLNKRRLQLGRRAHFSDDVFAVSPSEGELWPHSSLEVTVAFRPAEARPYTAVAFCEVTGRETRLSLRMGGVGLGPKVEFSFRTLEMGFIFVGAHHCYEVVLANRGDIDALFKIKGTGSLASKCFSFTPDDGLISPGSHQAVRIHFHSKEFLGDFHETFSVKMDGCLEPLALSFKGAVIGPTFNFNVSKLQFGEVSVGFPRSEEVLLTNSSLVPLQYRLRVPTDGTADPLLASDPDGDLSPRDYCSRFQPREFSIEPAEATLAPLSSCPVTVTITPNSVGKHHTAIVVDVIGVGEEVFSLPLSACAVVPAVQLSCPELDFSRCFLRHPYIKVVTVTNGTSLPARYQLMAQTEDVDKLIYHSPLDKAVVEAHSKLDISIELTALTIGELSTTLKFKVFGSTKEPMEVTIRCIGEGPVVNISAISLDWGTIKVLEDRSLSLTMSNESEIAAVFSASMMKEESVFRVSPHSGVLARHQSLELQVVANLNDCVRFSDELRIQVEDSKTKVIPLIATGSGTTIHFDPPLLAAVDLGAHFSNSQLRQIYRITNKGKRHQQLVWSNEGYSYTKALRQTDATKNPMQAPILTVLPHRFDLSPGESADLVLQGYLDKPKLVNERILCHAIIGRQGGKELIKKVDFTVNFVLPIVEFSEKKLHFRIDKSLFNEFEILNKSFTLRNVSGLSLHIHIVVPPPFSIVDPSGDYFGNKLSLHLMLNSEEEKTLMIQFDPLFKTDCNSRTIEEIMKVSYEEHPHTDEIRLLGEVNFPNLDFDRLKIDFDCILNHSEVSQFVTMRNNSPLTVNYSWSLIIGDKPNIIFHRKRPVSSVEEEEEMPEVIIDAPDKDRDTEKPFMMEVSDSDMISPTKDSESKLELSTGLKLDLSFEEYDNEEQDEQTNIKKDTKNQQKHLSFEKKVEEVKPKVNKMLKALLETESEIVPLGIEEVFDVKPLYGTLQPGDFEQVTFTYFGHSDVEAYATAVCDVEGGPSYKFELNGEASTVQYEFSTLSFDFGETLYDQVVFQEMTLTNKGKVGFEFTSKKASAVMPDNHYPVAQPILNPIAAFVPSGSTIVIKVGYFPGCPGNFIDTCKVQVGHYPMEAIELCGRATFPRVTLDLPRDNGMFKDTFDNIYSTKTLFSTDETFETLFARVKEDFQKSEGTEVLDSVISSYLEDLSVINQPKKWDVASDIRKSPKKHLNKPSLPAYSLDFGNVILGQVVSKTISTINTGTFPLTLKFIKNSMQQYGFLMNLNQVNNLPCAEKFQFEINFDPRAANLSLGKIESVLLLNIIGGPIVPVRMIANVTMPDLEPSSEIVEFDNIKVGQAKLVTIQLYNPTPVATEWTTLNSDLESTFASKNTKSGVIRKNKQKRLQEKKPLIFEMIPTAGELKPGQRLNVQIKFMPLEGKSYTHRLVMRLSQSSKRIVIKCVGQGLEPSLEFKDGFIQFEPVLPASTGCEKLITIRNPCPFPIEFYSLELDKVYLEEEKILRHISGYDEYGNMLIPPRVANEKLPQEFIDYYEERCKKGLDTESSSHKKNEIQEISEIEEIVVAKSQAVPQAVPAKSSMSYNDSESTALDDLEQTPVSQAIARYLGIELTPEGKAARRNRGIAIVVIGNPLSGKTDTSTKLAKKYSAALLTIDGVIIEAIKSASTPAAQRARDLCLETARRYEVLDMDECQEKKGTTDGNADPLGAFKRVTVNISAMHGFMQAPHNRKTSTVSTIGRHPSKQSSSNKEHQIEKPESNTYLLSASPPPLAGPTSSKLNVFAAVGDENISLMSCILPDDVIIQILSERLMMNDCQKGVVFDGLESLFAQNQSCAAQIILHSLNNRRFLYFVTLKRNFNSIKEEEKEAEEKEKLLNEKEEEDELIWMTEMTEEEYEALDDSTKRRLEEKRLRTRREKKKKELEEKERERQLQEEYEAEMQRLKEEKASKQKGGKKGAITDDKVKSKGGKETAMGGRVTRENTNMNKEVSVALSDKHITDRPESHMTELSLEGEDKKKKLKGLEKKSVGKIEELQKEPQEPVEEVYRDPKKEQEWLLYQKFKTFDNDNKQIVEILSLWDRAHPPMKQTMSMGEGLENVIEESVGNRRGGKTTMGSKKLKDHGNIHTQPATTSLHSPNHDDAQEVSGDFAQEEIIGVPNVTIDVSKRSVPERDSLIESNLDLELPSVEDVMEGLGLGPKGPPIPPPATFSIVKFPLKRRSPNLPEMFGENGHYNFMGTLEDKDEEKKENIEKDEEKSSEKTKDDGASGSSPAKSVRPKKSDTKDRLGNRKGSGKKASTRRSSQSFISPISAPTPMSDDGTNDIEPYNEQTQTYRWVIHPESEINLRLRFKSDELGQFDQPFNFELVDTRRKYQVFCRGICAFPIISKEPRIVFSHRQRNKEAREIVHKKYIIDEEVFEFGPLLIHKDKQRVMDNKFPENVEQITIKNTSPLVADINFSLLNDAKGERFALDPPTMLLQPDKMSKLTIWAFPRAAQLFEDAIVCCLKENPEPVIYKISCLGVQPFVELDRKFLQFSKVLLHRKDMTNIYMKNNTALPVAWQLTGFESLGDEFSVAQDSGIIEPMTEFRLDAYFRAMKPYKANQKKNIRLEIYDTERIAGILQTETIQVLAEAYDVALDMSFPKGATNGLDMGVLRVGDEAKQAITLKNRGPYEIKYRFELESGEKKKYDYSSMFTLVPNQGTLQSGDKAIQVQISYCAKEEVYIKDEQILKCHIIEPNVTEGEEVIATIPIRISVKSVFSKYQITPKSDINFGAVVVQTKKTRQITIDNIGEFDFKFTVHRSQKAVTNGASNLANKDSQQKDSTGVAPSKMKPGDNMLVGGSQARLQAGNFILFPAMGVIPPKGSVVIIVDCISDNPGRCDESLVIDITDRNPRLDLSGIQYRLFVEAFVPNIDVTNIATIFEEHRICDSLTFLNKDIYQACSGGFFGTNENRFLFTNVLVGSKVEAKFRLDNPYKVPCDISLTIKPIHGGRTSGGGRGSASIADIFEVEPSRAQIEPRGCLYACVVFSPMSMQQYIANFECNIEGLPQNSLLKSKSLAFEVCGEGYLPRVTVIRPILRNKKSQFMCLFKKSLLGRIQNQKIDLLNEGSLPCRIHVDVIDPDGVFWVKVGDIETSDLDKSLTSEKPHDLILSLDVNAKQSIDVFFKPKASGRYCSNVKITIVNNQYEDTIVQLIGEGYEDFISFENLPPVEVTNPILPKAAVSTTTVSKTAIQPPPDEINDATKNNVLTFGDCYVNKPKTISFSLVNHSKDSSIRFSWPSGDAATANPATLIPIKFSPAVGHLHPGQSLNILATMMSSTAKVWSEKPIQCKVVKINLIDLDPGQKPLNWDDSKKTMKWIDSVTDGAAPASARKKKVIETEPEPKFVELMETLRSLDLCITANVDYCRCKCKTTEISFQDTMLFESRTHRFKLKNEGNVNMKYQIRVKLDECEVFTPRSSRPSTVGGNADCIEDDETKNPFLIEPSSGIVKPDDKQQIQVSFSPLSISYFRATLVCEIDNMEASASKPTISLMGRSLQPFCHFELMDSDYLISGRRDPTLRGPGGAPSGNGLNPSTRVLELSVVGLTTREIKRFGVVNPTKTDFSFQWICDDISPIKGQSPIQCLIPSGMIEAGRKSQCSFQFTSQTVGISESFWRFEIPEIGISVPFLIVGQCIEPNVTFNKSHFKFPALLVGHESVETIELMNFDNQSYQFSFQEISRHAPGHSNSLRIEPMSGIISANSSSTVHVGFLATSNQILNFNLVCHVERKTYPLTVNVKAEGYSVDSTVWIESDTGHSTELVPMLKSGDQDVGNILDLGRAEIGEQLTRFITLANDGKFNFDFNWDLRWKEDPKLSAVLQLRPTSGTVLVGQKLRCEVLLIANRHTSFSKVQACLAITYGQSYLLNIAAEIRKPLVSFSFEKYDFGHCFVYRAGMQPLTVQLVIQNKDSKSSGQRPVSIECLTEPTDVLMHNFCATVLAPGASIPIDLTFLPRKPTKYSINLVFELNGMSRQSVELTGSCEELKMETLGLTNHQLNLGILKVGEKVSKTVSVANKAHVPIVSKFVFSPSNESLQQRGILKIVPLVQEVTIQPGKANAIPIEVIFSPTKRVQKFTEEVYCETMGVTLPLFVITGGCFSHDIRLDLESISFGLVTKGSQLLKRLSMMNYGDIGARFKWNIESFKPDFSICPIQGYISPGMEVVFEVTFRPTKVSADIRYDNISCAIEGWKNLPIVLTGVCQLVTPVKETINFSCSVRQQEVKSIKINNTSNANWILKPVIEGDHWVGSATFVVEPQQLKNYEVTFRPLTMTQEGKKHTGSVFFAIPDGSGLLFNLTGNAEAPKVVSKINRELPARTSYTELLDVPNWLKRPQRFKVIREILKPEKSDSSVVLKGFDYIDVPGGSSKQYKFTFTAQKEGQLQLKVTFLNESTGEYQFYELQVKVFKAASTAKIQLTSPVRQSVQHSILLENNTAAPITYQISSTSNDIHCSNQFQVQPQTKIPFTFEFFPLRVGDSTAKLEISSIESGNVSYDLDLVGTVPREEQPLVFQTSIGASQTLYAHFKNWTKNKIDFSCRIDNAKFACDKSITVAPNVDAQLEVHFEPSKLGEVRAMLIITNSVAGEFVFPLLGTASTPKPQGPYSIKAGSNVSINFRNVFSDAVQFYFHVDNPAFRLNKNSENIKAHKDHRILIGFDGSADGGPVMGKLTVTCPEAEAGLSKLQWVFYLRGLQRD